MLRVILGGKRRPMTAPYLGGMQQFWCVKVAATCTALCRVTDMRPICESVASAPGPSASAGVRATLAPRGCPNVVVEVVAPRRVPLVGRSEGTARTNRHAAKRAVPNTRIHWPSLDADEAGASDTPTKGSSTG